jgi:hypothetical protein
MFRKGKSILTQRKTKQQIKKRCKIKKASIVYIRKKVSVIEASGIENNTQNKYASFG